VDRQWTGSGQAAVMAVLRCTHGVQCSSCLWLDTGVPVSWVGASQGHHGQQHHAPIVAMPMHDPCCGGPTVLPCSCPVLPWCPAAPSSHDAARHV
jgi:hypothetical protein